jgi:PIN domain nuclease of toxin-antitoxin system
MAIKKSLGKLEMDIPLDDFIQGQLDALRARLLPAKASHALAVEHFPFHHRDPFDRLLAAQALTEEMELVSADPVFDAYPVSRLW